ncbi:WXG100 family type VII secretion target [Sphaerisporangium fuscum]|uniref:WXG100 family type VII secretion target n=1 Tax=Sphaerisporangium fuscum TaxID=2835868 RepID=UPI001BDD6CC8|nr:WXG100 family type VII secretion target [Sphaerisporangium fuscum]
MSDPEVPYPTPNDPDLAGPQSATAGPPAPKTTGPPPVSGPGAGVLDITQTGLAALAGLFDGQAADLLEALHEAEEDLADIGDFWGGDSTGRKFYEGDQGGRGYKDVLNDIRGEVMVAAGKYVGIGDRLVLMGRRIQATDQPSWPSFWAFVSQLPEVPK